MDIPNLTQTLDTMITCTLCHGGGLAIVGQGPIWARKTIPCPNCSGTKVMKSRTTEEQERLDREIKDYNVKTQTQ